MVQERPRTRRGAPRSGLVEQSFCRYVVGSGRSLVVDDAAADDRTCDDAAIGLMGVAPWAGFPVTAPGGDVLWGVCVVDTVPRRWTDLDIHVLATLAAAVSSEIELIMVRRELAEARSALRALFTQATSGAAAGAVPPTTPVGN